MSRQQVSKRQQLAQLARQAQAMQARAQVVVPREQRFVQELVGLRAQVREWINEVEATADAAERAGGYEEAVAVFREHLAEVHALDARLLRVYVATLKGDLERDPAFVRAVTAKTEELERTLAEILAEAAAREKEAVVRGPAEPEAPAAPPPADAPAGKLVLLPGQG